jgi:hypothetical protein
MKSARWWIGLILAGIVIFPVAADEPIVNPPPAKEHENFRRFLVYASEKDSAYRSLLFRVLRGSERVSSFAKADTIEVAAESDVEVLIIVMIGADVPDIAPEIRERLRNRKLIGIGAGAAKLFGQLGFEINQGNCAHFRELPSTGILLSKSELLGEPRTTDAFPLFKVSEGNSAYPDTLAMFVPSGDSNRGIVEVIARWSFDRNYAPITRQGQCVLIGVTAPPTQWTEGFGDVVRNVCNALHELEATEFTPIQRKITAPGTYEFTLAKLNDEDAPFDQRFYFQFPEATKLTARLEHSGSNAVMLLFSGQNEDRSHFLRLDAKDEESLELSIDLDDRDLEIIANRYWTLHVTNFDSKNIADCKLVIHFEKP